MGGGFHGGDAEESGQIKVDNIDLVPMRIERRPRQGVRLAIDGLHVAQPPRARDLLHQ